MNRARVREQADDSFEDLLEVERGANRRDDLVEEALLDCCGRLLADDLYIVRLEGREWKFLPASPGARHRRVRPSQTRDQP